MAQSKIITKAKKQAIGCAALLEIHLVINEKYSIENYALHIKKIPNPKNKTAMRTFIVKRYFLKIPENRSDVTPNTARTNIIKSGTMNITLKSKRYAIACSLSGVVFKINVMVGR